MVTATEVRKGQVLNIDGELFQVTDTRHSTPGNKRGFIQMKIKSLSRGNTIQRKFSSTESVDIAFLDTRGCEYLYRDGDGFVFMDSENYEQYNLTAAVVGDLMGYVKLNEVVKVTFYEGNPLSVELPSSVVLKVIQTEPGLKGNTVTNVYKPAVLETDLEIKVPMYINIDEKVKVDTRSGEFIGRAN
jgi:elongation factor P